MLNFCTLFDTNYLARGFALYESLQQVCPSFHLYVFAFDDHCYRYLKQHPAEHLTPVSLKDFENPSLLLVKPSRSVAEYCWTSTPFTILYCLEKFNLPECTYLDSDMVFYNDPQVLINEMGNKSVLISEHRYPPLYDQSWYSGIYCVQFMCFKNNPQGLEVLHWWKDRCIEWCYARLEDGKFGDQKYLDDWTTRFDSIHVMQHPGGGLAPWNLIKYSFYKDQTGIWCTPRKSTQKYPVIFFHFHGLKFFNNKKVLLSGPLYEIRPSAKQIFYLPYIKQLLQIASVIYQVDSKLHANGDLQAAPSSTKIFMKFIKDRLHAFGRYIPGAFDLNNYNFKNHHHLENLSELEFTGWEDEQDGKKLSTD